MTLAHMKTVQEEVRDSLVTHHVTLKTVSLLSVLLLSGPE